MILQNKTHYRRVTPFARSQKNQHKYIFMDWKLYPIFNRKGKMGEGVGIRMLWVGKN